VSAAEICERLAVLRESGRHLRRRRAVEILDALGQVLELWRDPSSPPRDALSKQLPEATGFSEPVVRAGLDHALVPFGRDALFALVESELGGVAALEAFAQAVPVRLVSGFDATALILAGALPTPTLVAMLAPLVLRSPVLVKPASRDPVTAGIVAMAPIASSDAESLGALLEAECVVATGSDATVAALAARVAPSQRFVGYGHRLSVAALGADAQSGDALAEAMRGLAVDVALWDQQGCLSPLALYVVGGGAEAPDRAAEALAAALAEAAERLPRGRPDAAAAALVSHERAEAEMRAAAGARVAVHAGPGTSWTVVREADARHRRAPLERFVRVHPVADEAALLDTLGPLAPHLAAVGCAGFDPGRLGALAPALAGLGASRICPLGSMQAPPLAWCHDGRGVLAPLARFCDREAG
jgi:hypothetical protein